MVASLSTDSDGLVRRCQGSRSRRVARYIMAIWLGALFIEPDVLKSQSLGSRLQAILITAVVVAAFDVWFSRRMGLTIDERGITLHYAFHRKRVPWAKVQGFEWKRWNSPRSEWIWITLSGGQAIRIPTIQRSPGGEKRSVVYRLLASEKVRIRGGAEVDAMATLQRAHATIQNAMSVANEPASAELSDQALRGSGEIAANTTP
jgi:hypothetical protein